MQIFSINELSHAYAIHHTQLHSSWILRIHLFELDYTGKAEP